MGRKLIILTDQQQFHLQCMFNANHSSKIKTIKFSDGPFLTALGRLTGLIPPVVIFCLPSFCRSAACFVYCSRIVGADWVFDCLSVLIARLV